MTELDTTRAPRGVLAAQALVASVSKQGDWVERHYLELKSTLDLSTKRDKEKIAKFILGASNRLPDVAATAFEGYGVMIIGVEQGAITGIPQIETMEISKVIQRYVGAGGPRWDIVWVPIEDSGRHVLLVLVDPPRLGQGPFPCRANGESLTDGRIYIRADGETREAKSDEVDLLVRRGASGVKPDVDFFVEVIGEVASVTFDAAGTVDEFLAWNRGRLIAALPGKEPSSGAYAGFSSALKTPSTFMSAMTEPEGRTEEGYLGSIDRWETHFRAEWDAAKLKIVASQLPSTVIRITNRTKTFFHDVEVKLHLEGDVLAIDYHPDDEVDDFSDLGLSHPPRKWGPRQRSFGASSHANLSNIFTPRTGPYIPPSISYRNGDSVSLNLDVGELRPQGTYESEDNVIVLLVSDRSMTTVHGTWTLTARNHNDIYTGDIFLDVVGHRDLTEVARKALDLERRVEADEWAHRPRY